MQKENYLFNPATQKWDLIKKAPDLRYYAKGRGLKEDFKTEINMYWEKEKETKKLTIDEILNDDPFLLLK